MWVPKLLLPPVRIKIFGHKTGKFGPKYAFLVILGQILAFLAHFVPCPLAPETTFQITAKKHDTAKNSNSSFNKGEVVGQTLASALPIGIVLGEK